MKPIPLLLCLAACLSNASAKTTFVEAESFETHGGWVLDTQFIEIMGSPYLMAHGLGKPVSDATTTIKDAPAGKVRVWVRTKNWVGPWDATGTPGKFKILVNGKALEKEFGTTGKDWLWEDGGVVELPEGATTLTLQDQTGFNGRVDAIHFSSDLEAQPPQEKTALAKFRHEQLGLPLDPPTTKEYDLVVVGGGYAGTASALSAARQGLKVALIQNRPVLGGNGSSEVQVWAQGGTRRGLYPHLGEIVDEFTDRASNSPGRVEEYGDDLKESIVRKEKKLDLFFNHHVWKAEVEERREKKITSVTALDTKTGAEKKFLGRYFVDCTGHGSLGALAKASYTMLEKGHLGMSNMWVLAKKADSQPWPETPWALQLDLEDFPAPHAMKGHEDAFLKGEWFWESGFDKHPIEDLELVRDWNLRAVFGAYSSLRKNDPEKYGHYKFDWIAFIGGTRESRLLQGDVVLTGDDIVGKRQFPDGCVPTTWDLDLHYPKEQFMKKYADNPFISRAAFGKGVDRHQGYPVPYRCFYSKDIDNLFMAGRNISVTHEALGTTRVMRTCGMMGEVVGKAAYLCVRHETSPRGVYEQYLDNLKDLMSKPGAMRRDNIEAALYLPADAPTFEPHPEESIQPAKLSGLVIDDNEAELSGTWAQGHGLKPYVGEAYRYTSDQNATAKFAFSVKESGNYEVRINWQPHQNRAASLPVTIVTSAGPKEVVVNQKKAATLERGFHSLGTFSFEAGAEAAIIFRVKGVKGNVHIDAAQVLPAKAQ